MNRDDGRITVDRTLKAAGSASSRIIKLDLSLHLDKDNAVAHPAGPPPTMITGTKKDFRVEFGFY